MRTTSLDILEKAQLPGSQAKAILRVMELELEDHRQTLATHADMAAIRAEMAGIKTELKIDIAELRAEMHHELGDVRGDLRGGLGELRAEIAKARNETILWVVGAGFTIAGLTLSVALYYLNHLHRI